MATPRQVAANRANAQKSTGPTTVEGKARARLNGLKHGLRSDEVVLPSENSDEFQSHLQAWMDDWQPASETRRFLVERAALAAWRLRRVARVEARRTAERAIMAVGDWDRAVADRADALFRQIPANPPAAIAALLGSREGIARLIALGRRLAAALEVEGGWDDYQGHHCHLLALLGIGPRPEADQQAVVDASWGLLLRSCPDLEECGVPLSDEAAPRMASALRELCEARVDELSTDWHIAPVDTAERRGYLETRAFDAMADDATLHRYEGRLDREARSAIGLLIKLEQTGADLATTEPDPVPMAAPSEPHPDPTVAPTEPNPGPVEPPNEPNAVPENSTSVQADRDRGGRHWPLVSGPTEIESVRERRRTR